MNIIRNIISAFSLYSRIPMPQMEWREGDNRHSMVFLPWIGGVIGAVVYGLTRLLELPAFWDLPVSARVMILTAVPIIITGGFHLDGFMDVMDGLNSFGDRENKLRILKDPHIGSFAVIRLILLGLVWLAALAVIINIWMSGQSSSASPLQESAITGYEANRKYIEILCISFFGVRGVCGLLALMLRHAKKDGLLNSVTDRTETDGSTDLWLLGTEIALSFGLMIRLDPVCGAGALIGVTILAWRYRKMCYREFGGVTGDTAGYFIVMGETVCAVMIAVLAFVQTR